MVMSALLNAGAQAKIVAPHLGYLKTMQGNDVKIHFSLLTASSVLFDAVYIPGGKDIPSTLGKDPAALEFIFETYKHAKAIGASGSGAELLRLARILDDSPQGETKRNRSSDESVVVSASGSSEQTLNQFIEAVGKHRNWAREALLRPDLAE